ncbi:hypothetical protein BFJ67_g2089 [Fusarium oxysporum f. sp. cepae]|nr:hypothetical protein BFJ67_g2089 [Fusarium oxysporum f. sp. cepae]
MVPSNPSTQAVILVTSSYGRVFACVALCIPSVHHFRKTVLPRRQRPKQAHKASFANSFSNVAITVVASTQIDFDLFLAIVTVLIALQFTDPTLICDGTVPAQSLLYDLTSSRNVSVHSNEV